MSQVEDRLAAMGLSVPDVVAPLAAYVPAVRYGDTVLVSGQLPSVGGKLPVTGKVGAEVSQERATEMARNCALNAIAAARSVVPDLDTLRVVKVVGFVASDPSFTGQPAVINGASELLGQVFGEHGVHARSAVGVAALPLDTPVEVEMTFVVRG